VTGGEELRDGQPPKPGNYVTADMWNADGMVAPPYLGTTFPGSTTHLHTSGSTVIDSQDIEMMIKMLRVKGFGVRRGIALHRPRQPRRCRSGDDDRLALRASSIAVAGRCRSLTSSPGQAAPAYFVPKSSTARDPQPSTCRRLVGRTKLRRQRDRVQRAHSISAYQGLRIIPGRDQRFRPISRTWCARSVSASATGAQPWSAKSAPAVPTPLRRFSSRRQQCVVQSTRSATPRTPGSFVCRSDPVHQVGRIAAHQALRLGIGQHLLDGGDHFVDRLTGPSSCASRRPDRHSSRLPARRKESRYAH
jgi:hypothetical protein